MDATWKTRTARGCCRLWRRVHLDAGAVRAHGVAAWRHLEAPGGEAGRLTVAGGVGFSESTALLAIPLGPIEIFPKGLDNPISMASPENDPDALRRADGARGSGPKAATGRVAAVLFGEKSCHRTFGL